MWPENADESISYLFTDGPNSESVHIMCKKENCHYSDQFWVADTMVDLQ